MKKLKLKPHQVIVLSFILVILLGTFLLNLPISTKEHVSPGILNSLFTATSATCVTGLIVKDTGSYFSSFGRLVILILIQAGGLGIMTFSTAFAVLLGKKLTISHNITIQKALNHSKIQGLKELMLYILAFTFSIETIGAVLLYLRWGPVPGKGILAGIEQAIFHAVSAFCNAGFSLFPNSLRGFATDTVTLAVFITLIIIGGLGFIVFLDIPKLKFWRKDRRLIFSRVSLQTKLVLTATIILILCGTAGVLLLENNCGLKGMGIKDKIMCGIFTSVTPRTAGFNVLPTGALRPATLFMLIFFMFIGASPGSTGGGIKTATFGVMVAAFVSMLYNRDRISIFKKTIPRNAYRRSAVILFLSLGIVALSTFLLSITEAAGSSDGRYFLNVLFEATSAFGTVGLSAGITPHLSSIGKFIIILTMFVGRVGPLTVALAISMRKDKIDYTYPEERLMVG